MGGLPSSNLKQAQLGSYWGSVRVPLLRSMGLVFTALLSIHKLYSRALLSSARARLLGQVNKGTHGFSNGESLSIAHTESEYEIHCISFRKHTRREEKILFEGIKN
jgi:uncharacterized DUF497 family protein